MGMSAIPKTFDEENIMTRNVMQLNLIAAGIDWCNSINRRGGLLGLMQFEWWRQWRRYDR